jgi:hypothetical protein
MNRTVFVEDSSGPDRYTGFFEQTDGTEEGTPPGGYLYVSDHFSEQVVGAVEVYRAPLELTEGNVKVFWSTDGTKCGVEIWGRMRGIIDVTTGDQVHVEVSSPQSPAITDPEWLRGFDSYLDHHQFVRVRQRFWKVEAQHCDPEARPLPENETPIETNFIMYEKGPDDLFAVFEDDGHSGYLYLYDSKKGEIAENLHNYDRSVKMNVQPEDVEVVWSDDGHKCAVIIGGKMRGIIDRQKPVPGRVWMEDGNSPGIADEEWLKGFEYLRSDDRENRGNR